MQDIDLNKFVAEKELRAYQRGFRDAIEKIKESALEELGKTETLPLFPKEQSQKQEKQPVTRRRPDYIIDFVRDNPGMVISQISAGIRKNNPEITDKAIKVATYRLKDKELVNLEGRWYVNVMN